MKRLLVIDDDDIDREFLQRLLTDSDEKFQITEAASGSEGMAMLEKNVFHCVFLDYLLPDMDGLTFIRKAKERWGEASFPILMLTGEGSEEVAVEAMKLGVTDYLVKNRANLKNSLAGALHNATERWLLKKQKAEAEKALRLKTVELEKAKRDAEFANKAKSEFLAAMSHDLRTPLNAIMGFSDIMRHKALGPMGNRQYEEYADHIYESGELLVSLIDDILDLAKVESGKFNLFETPLDTGELTKDLLNMFSTLSDAKNVKLVRQTTLPSPYLIADEKSVAQILNNLVSNAVKFTPNGGMVTIAVSQSAEGEIYFRVEDTGIGMSHDDLERALKPFEQADSLHARRHEGTGLGLHLCQKLIELHGGRLEMTSAQGEGTAATVFFPPGRTVRSLS